MSRILQLIKLIGLSLQNRSRATTRTKHNLEASASGDDEGGSLIVESCACVSR